MSRRGSSLANGGADPPRRRRAGDHGPGGADCEPASVLAILGIPEAALTPELRDGVARLAVERDRLRDELVRARSKIASLERLADEDALTPVANRRAFVR